MSLKLITDSVTDPITVSEMKENSRIDGTAEDTLVANLVASATDLCEHKVNRQFVSATWKLTLNDFPCDRFIKIDLPPLQSVTSIQYYDTDGTQQTFDSSNYTVDTNSEPGRVYLNSGSSWPSTESQRYNSVEITFIAGYGAAADVPQGIKQAITMMASHFYENREATTETNLKDVPMAVESLLERYKWGKYN